jgi:hypothetical protein
MQVFVREHYTMIAAPVQCDAGGIPKGSHYVLPKRANEEEISHGHGVMAGLLLII